MQTPSPVGSHPLIRVEGLQVDVIELMVNQRDRLTEMLAELTADQWETPSRCERWTVQDVITHLTTTNAFWSYSITCALTGTPSEILGDFDPVTTPAELVKAAPEMTPDESLAAFARSNRRLAEAASGVDEEHVNALAEAPPGLITLEALMLHALWDSLIHERDIAVPLGIETEVVTDEVYGSLAYASALGMLFAWGADPTRTGTLEIRGTDPMVDVSIVLDGGVAIRPLEQDSAGKLTNASTPAGTMAGRSTDLLESVSVRAPLDGVIDAEHRWMAEGLATAFS